MKNAHIVVWLNCFGTAELFWTVAANNSPNTLSIDHLSLLLGITPHGSKLSLFRLQTVTLPSEDRRNLMLSVNTVRFCNRPFLGLVTPSNPVARFWIEWQQFLICFRCRIYVEYDEWFLASDTPFVVQKKFNSTLIFLGLAGLGVVSDFRNQFSFHPGIKFFRSSCTLSCFGSLFLETSVANSISRVYRILLAVKRLGHEELQLDKLYNRTGAFAFRALKRFEKRDVSSFLFT